MINKSPLQWFAAVPVTFALIAVTVTLYLLQNMTAARSTPMKSYMASTNDTAFACPQDGDITDASKFDAGDNLFNDMSRASFFAQRGCVLFNPHTGVVVEEVDTDHQTACVQRVEKLRDEACLWVSRSRLDEFPPKAEQ
jgi:hypothetical protein